MTDAEWIVATGAPLVPNADYYISDRPGMLSTRPGKGRWIQKVGYTTGHADALHVICNHGPIHRFDDLVVESTWISGDARWLAIVFADGTDVVFMTSDDSPICAYASSNFRGRTEPAAGFPTDSTLFRVEGISDTGERIEFRSYWFWCGESEPGLGQLWIACTSNPVLAPHLRMEAFSGWIQIDPNTPRTFTSPHRAPPNHKPKGLTEP